jgi:hypothetical protein
MSVVALYLHRGSLWDHTKTRNPLVT